MTIAGVALVTTGLLGTQVSAFAQEGEELSDGSAAGVINADGTSDAAPDAAPNADAAINAVANQIMQIDAEVASLAQQYGQSEIALEQARSAQSQLSEALLDQQDLVSRLQVGIIQLVNTQRQDPGFGVAVNFVIAESPDAFISTMATMDSVESILSEQAARFRSEQSRMNDLTLQLDAQVELIQEQVVLQQQLIAAQEAKRAQVVAARNSLAESQLARLDNAAGENEAVLPLSWPNNGTQTSTFGWRDTPSPGYHTGNDYASYCGAPIRAAAAGTVIRAGWSSWYGEYVEIDHGRVAGDYFRTGYAHMSDFIVTAGQPVVRGQIIGFEGNTGESYGCHLHFNVIINGKYSDSRYYMA
ncbi:MAG: M23 family metallopeptidase [Propionibacteriaceae bacterium]|nr:M23 family metallopeptidase [Propionibacteriaceae bacterium]